MAEAAMFLWVLAAGAGTLLLIEWHAQGGASGPGRSHLPEPLVVGHFLSGLAGGISWIIYLLVRATSVAWAGFVLAGLISFLGLGLFVRWLPVRDTEEDVPEKYFPYPLVGAHGLFATAIVVLTLLTALGIG